MSYNGSKAASQAENEGSIPFTRSITNTYMQTATQPLHTPTHDADHTLEIGTELLAKSGEIILISGSCGSGKTLWLHRLAGLVPMPAEIDARINHQPVAKQITRMLFEQWPAIWQGQSVDDELRFGLGYQPDEQQIKAALSRWGVSELAVDCQTTALNRLQAVRVTLAGISMAAPVVTLLDNPTDALPAADAAQLIADISDWARASKTIVVVACNRWHDWQQTATQHWQVLSPDSLPQSRGHA